ncbi:hypothetical protein [Amycolatopsis sp. lyj-23]|uniref:hypothetical protein n=1 Tax=Amycolatopsis sp. lyj-23 TaxID=2789283 RepID=UPI00397DFC70
MTRDAVLRRHFVAIATAEYDDRHWCSLPVGEEVAVLRAWLCADHLGDRRFEHRFPELAENPAKRDIRDALENPPAERRWREADAAVVFVTGHAEEVDEAHHLILKETDSTRKSATAFASFDLIRWLADTEITHLVVILDACYAGMIVGELSRLSRQPPDTWLVLASASKTQDAGAGVLSSAITAFLGELASREGAQYGHAPYLSVEDLLDGLRDHLGYGQTPEAITRMSRRLPHVCLPNPHHRPDASVDLAPARHDLALSRQDLRTHWGPKARGVATDDEPGWLFTGRTYLMRALIAAASGPPGTTLVTGAAGSGKSAVLARLVTLSDPEFLRTHAEELEAVPDELLPPSGAVDVAVVATGKLEIDVLDQILRAFDVPLPADDRRATDITRRLAAWHAWLAAIDRPVTVIVDAVDEATAPRRLFTQLLARLDPDPREPRIRLLLGLRSPGGEDQVDRLPFATPPLADLAKELLNAERIQVDEAPWWDPADVSAYIAGVLRHTAGSRYDGDNTARTAGLAAALGAQVGRSFLFARLAAASLAHGTLGESWDAALRQGVIGVFKADLHGTFADPADRHRAVVLLRAVAFAYGTGLPWRKIWPRVANAVGNSDYEFGDTDISWLLDSRLGAYLVTDRQDGATVYRLFHDLLRSTLREQWRELIDAPPHEDDSMSAVEARIAIALADLLTPGTPPAYVRRHIVEHAAAGGVLDDRFLDPAFLPYFDAARLRSVTGQVPAGDHPLVRLWRQTPQSLSPDAAAANADALRFRLAAEGNAAWKSVRPGPGWQPRWLSWNCEPAEILARHTGSIHAVAAATLPGGQPIVLAGGDDGSLGRWDLSSGKPVGDPLPGHNGAIRAIATATLGDGRVVAVTGGTDGTSRVWDLGTSTPIGTPFECKSSVMSAAVARLGDGRTVAITSDDSAKAVHVRDILTGEPVARITDLKVRSGPSLDSAVLPEGRVLVAAVSAFGDVRVCDVTTGDTVYAWNRVTGNTSGVFSDPALLSTIHGTASAVATSVLPDGRVVAVVGSTDGMLWVHDLADGQEILSAKVPEGHGVKAMAVVEMPGGQNGLIVLAGSLWISALGGEPLEFGPLGTGAPDLNSVAAIVLSGRGAVAVTGGRDAAVRLWHLSSDTAAARLEPERIRAFATTRLPNNREVALHDHGETLCVADLRNGTKVRQFDEGRRIGRIGTVTLPDGRVAVVTASGWDPLIRVWDLVTGEKVSEIWTNHGLGVTTMATAALPDGRAVVTSTGSFNSGIHLWNPITGASLGRVARGPFAGARAVKMSRRPDGTVYYEIGGDGHPLNGFLGIRMVVTAVMPGGRVVALAGGDDGTVCVWDLVTRRRVGDVNLGCKITTGTTTTLLDGRVVAVLGSEDGTLWVTDIATLQPIGKPISAHAGRVTALTAVPLADGRPVVISAGYDGVVQVMDPISRRSIGHPLLLDGDVHTLHGVPRRKAPQVLIGGNGVACMELLINNH